MILKLCRAIHHIVDIIRKNATVDWSKRSDVRAKLRLTVRKILMRVLEGIIRNYGINLRAQAVQKPFAFNLIKRSMSFVPSHDEAIIYKRHKKKKTTYNGIS